MKNQIEIYRTLDNQTEVKVKFEKETVWLNQRQMADLFNKDSDTIGLHLKNIFYEKELEKNSTTENFSVVQQEGKRQVKRNITFYNLDAIISVGYRVKSIRGTQFRIWANKIIKDYLLKGYALNEKRLKELKQTIKLVENVIEKQTVSGNEATALLKLVADYAYALDVLDDYDYQRVKINKITKKKTNKIDYKEAIKIIEKLKKEFCESTNFGIEKDESLKSSLATIFQTFDGKDLYPSIEEKSANLLYFLVKNHSFVDGNKRIAAALFLWFMRKNKFLYRKDGSKKIANNALVAITLMIAQSNPKEKEIICNVVVNLINKSN